MHQQHDMDFMSFWYVWLQLNYIGFYMEVLPAIFTFIFISFIYFKSGEIDSGKDSFLHVGAMELKKLPPLIKEGLDSITL